MANAVASYNRNHDPNMMAIWAYLQESAQSTAAQQQQQQQPPPQQTTSGAAPPLPPLVPTRRTSAQNLPPVRNLLTHPEEWRSEGVQQLQGEGVSGSNAKVVMCGNSADFVKVSNLAMGTTAGGSEEGGDMMGKSVDKPLKRGPKGPRKYTAPRPLGPLKLLAPKLSDKEGEAESVRTTKKTRQRKRPASKATITSDPAPKSSTDSNIRPTAEVGDNGFTMNTAPETGISQAFNVPDYGSVMEPSMLGTGGTTMNTPASLMSHQSPSFPELHHSHFSSFHNSNPESVGHHGIITMAYSSPQTDFSPTSDSTGFAQMYHSPVFATSHSGHVSPHSPLHSMHNSPHTFRSTMDPLPNLQPQVSLTSPPQMFPSRLVNGNSNMLGGGEFASPASLEPSPSMLTEVPPILPTSKRKHLTDGPQDGPRRTLKPRTAVTAIQSVLNPATDGRLDGPTDPSPISPKTSHHRTSSPKRNRMQLPITPTSPSHLRIQSEPSIPTNPQILLSSNNNVSSSLNTSFQDTSDSLPDDHTTHFDLQNPNSLAMLLNSDHSTSLTRPSIYDYSLDPTSAPSNSVLSQTTSREMGGRLPVQSLLTLPPIPVDHSPSMEVMQIQPQSNLDLVEDRSLRSGERSRNTHSFDMRMAMDSSNSFGTGLSVSEVVGHHPSAWDDILIQPPPSTSTFASEMTNAGSSMYPSETNLHQRNEEQNTHPEIASTLVPTDNFVKEQSPSTSPTTASPNQKKKRRGKHSRYVAAEGKNGEPDKTHIDLLVKTIQSTENPAESSGLHGSSPIDEGHLSAAVMSSIKNSLPSIETLRLDGASSQGQNMQGRGMDEMNGGVQSSNDQTANPQLLLDLFSQEEWTGMPMDIFLPPTNGVQQVPLSNRSYMWNQNEYPAPPPPAENSLSKHTSTNVGGNKRGRKSKQDRNRMELEKPRNADQGGITKRTKAAPFSCSHPGCTARFHQLQHMKTHMQGHEGVKPFKCDFEGCDQRFSQKGNLKAHRRKHTGEKPYVCQECDKAFAQKGNLQTHSLVHTGSKPYECHIDNCPAKYSQRGNLKMHQNKFHTERIQELTQKYQDSTRGGPALTQQEKEIVNHLKELYKFANKGIKGRGKKHENRQKQSSTPNNNGSNTNGSTTQVPDFGDGHEVREMVSVGEPQLPAPLSAGVNAQQRTYPPPTRQGEQNGFVGVQALLPPPVSKPPSMRGIDTPPSYMMQHNPPASWSRGEDVFIGHHPAGGGLGGTGGQGGGHGHSQTSNFIGIPNSASSGSLGGYSFGNMA